MPGQDFILRGDVGGFSVGSQFSWNALAAYSFVFSKRDGVTYSGLLGYRALSADYEQGSGRTKYVYDVVMHGPAHRSDDWLLIELPQKMRGCARTVSIRKFGSSTHLE